MNKFEFLYNIGQLMAYAKEKDIKVICFTFYRSPEQQKIEYDAGRSRTLRGKHQDWLAMDLALWDDVDGDGTVDKDELRWRDDMRYTILGTKWELLGGIWGGRWKSPHDIYHFEG